MGLESYTSPTKEGAVVGSLVENKFITGYAPSKEGSETHTAEETVSTLGKYRGGNFFGYSIKSKGAAEFTLYDNSEKAEGTIIGSPITFAAKEQKVLGPLNVPLKFKVGIFIKVNSGEIESGNLWLEVV